MSHIHTNPGQYDFTSSAYIVLLKDGSEPRVWMHQHKLLGMLLQFGGHVELDETPWQAVCHEITEESGYEMTQLQLLQPQLRLAQGPGTAMQPVPAAINSHRFGDSGVHYHTDLGFAFVTHEQPRLPVGEGEASELFLLTAGELRQLEKGRIPGNVRDEALFVLEQLLQVWDRVDCAEFDVNL